MSYPDELAQFIHRTESVSTSGNQSKGEDMDACLEEVNKESKTWQHDTMTANDWLRIFRNLENLSEVGRSELSFDKYNICYIHYSHGVSLRSEVKLNGLLTMWPYFSQGYPQH